jgi:pre-rRNA-processing protein TSR1
VLRAERFKTSLQFINLPYGAFYQTLDACKAADYVLFLLSPVTEVTAWGDTLLRSLQAQGLPTVVSVVPPSTATVSPRERTGILKSLLSFVQYFVPSQPRVFDLSTSADRLNAARALCEGRPADVRWRDGRAWVLGEDVRWTDEDDGTLHVTGVVRGATLSANRLVHIPNFGDFQVSKV